MGHFLFTLFVCVQRCPRHVVFCFVFLQLVYLMLPVFLGCPFLITLTFIEMKTSHFRLSQSDPMLSLFFVIVCGHFEWKRIYAVFLSFVFSIAVGGQIIKRGRVGIPLTG